MKKGLFLLLFLQPAFADNYKIHILKEGETLSEILWDNGYKPLYGENNWVQRTLEMNHLSSVQDKKIKKGFPIILPSKENPTQPATLTEYKTIKEIRYIAKDENYISKHQDVYISSGVTAINGAVNSKQVSFSDAMNLGFIIEGKNNYRLGQLIYNFDAEFNYRNSMTAKYDSESDIKLKPSYGLRTSMRLNKYTLPFDFGFTYKFEEESQVDYDQEVLARRDQNHWVGFRVNKNNVKFFNQIMHYEARYEKNIIQSTISDNQRYEASRLSLKARNKLTKNVLCEASLGWTSFQGTEINNNNATAFNLIYKVQ